MLRPTSRELLLLGLSLFSLSFVILYYRDRDFSLPLPAEYETSPLLIHVVSGRNCTAQIEVLQQVSDTPLFPSARSLIVVLNPPSDIDQRRQLTQQLKNILHPDRIYFDEEGSWRRFVISSRITSLPITFFYEEGLFQLKVWNVPHVARQLRERSSS